VKAPGYIHSLLYIEADTYQVFFRQRFVSEDGVDRELAQSGEIYVHSIIKEHWSKRVDLLGSEVILGIPNYYLYATNKTGRYLYNGVEVNVERFCFEAWLPRRSK